MSESSTASAARPLDPKILSTALSTALFMSFFSMPWAQIHSIGGSGFDLARSFAQASPRAYLLYAIPLACLTQIVLLARGVPSRLPGLVTGLLPFLFLIYGVHQLGSDLFRFLAVGAYLALFIATGLVYLSFRKG